MRNDIITISDNGQVSIPVTVSMMDFQIAELFQIMVPTVRGKIKTLLKTRHFFDCSGANVSGNRIAPEYYGLDMIIAIAFQVQSNKADIFRNYIMNRLSQSAIQPLIIQYSTLNNSDICS